MTQQERAELSGLLSGLMREIHQIPAGDLLVVMEVDERLRSGSVDTDDLERLRQILGRRQQAD